MSVLTPVHAGAEDAAKIAESFEQSAGGGAVCSVKRNSRTILCAVRTSDSEADKLARGIVYTTNAMDIDLSGWKITIVTPKRLCCQSAILKHRNESLKYYQIYSVRGITLATASNLMFGDWARIMIQGNHKALPVVSLVSIHKWQADKVAGKRTLPC